MLNLHRHLLRKLKRTRMQLAALPADEERHRHTPLPLARQRPVRTIRNHAVKTRFAPAGIELRSLDPAKSSRSQRLGWLGTGIAGHFVHTGEPLHRRPQDDRCLVSPAVHIAVYMLGSCEQGATLGDVLDDLRVRFPDVHAAEERQRRNIPAVAHYRSENFVILDAVSSRRFKILYTVSRSTVHDAGSCIER